MSVTKSTTQPQTQAPQQQPQQLSTWGKAWWWGSRIVVGLMTTAVAAATIWSAVSAQRALESNEESKASAAAAKSSAETMVKSYKLAIESNRTAKEHADAAKASADAANASAKSINEQVTIARDANKIAEESATAATAANTIASQTKKAAEATAEQTKRSVDQAGEVAIADMRAYLSVIGTELRYDRASQQLIARVTIENTGRTPAHTVTLYYSVECTNRIDGWSQPPQLIYPQEPTPTAQSVGPRAKFSYRKDWPVTRPDALGRTMDMWVWGRVEFTDEFTKVVHFTEFNFAQGSPVPGTTDRWELIILPRGNRTDSPADRDAQSKRPKTPQDLPVPEPELPPKLPPE